MSGIGSLTVTDSAGTRTIAVSGAPNIYTVASNGMPQDGEVTVSLSEGLSAYSFTFG